jgi:hypothetical protein
VRGPRLSRGQGHFAVRGAMSDLETGRAARCHGVADEGVPFRDIAGVIGRRLGVPVVGKPREDAAEH